MLSPIINSLIHITIPEFKTQHFIISKHISNKELRATTNHIFISLHQNLEHNIEILNTMQFFGRVG